MALNDIYNVQFFIQCDDKPACVNMHYVESVARTGTVAEVTEQLTVVMDDVFWTDFWQPFCSDDFTYLRTIGQKVFPTRDAPFISELSNGEAGASIGSPMNGTTAMVVAEYGETWGPNFRGRMYLSGLRESDVTLGRILAGNHSIIQGNFTTMILPAIVLPVPADATMTPCVFSPSRAKPPGDPPPPPILPVFSNLATAIVRPRIGTQRRRRTPIAATSV